MRSATWYLQPQNRNNRFLNLLLRVLDKSNVTLRGFVREVIVGAIICDSEKGESSEILRNENLLPTLVNALPNLQFVRLQCSMTLSDELIYCLDNHPGRPKLQILSENGTSAFPAELRCVSTLHATVDPSFERPSDNQQNRRIFNLQKLFFACPNLRTFSLTLKRRYGGCILAVPRFPIYRNFRPQVGDIFPPIEDLSFTGYRPDPIEWIHWRDKFHWSNLKTLSLGPDGDHYVLRLITGHARFLRRLKLTTWNGRVMDECEELHDFLLSFATLESLEVRGYWCSVRAIGNHPKLTTLCLHAIEIDKPGCRRKVLTLEDIRYLDVHCPNIKNLEVDTKRREAQWPTDIFRALAQGFGNLRNLSLHFELGICHHSVPLQPVLNYASAQEIGQSLFEHRWMMVTRMHLLSMTTQVAANGGVSPMRQLETLTLKTGEALRIFPQWKPDYVQWEKDHTMTFELRPQREANGRLRFLHLEKEEYEAGMRGSGSKPTFYAASLAERVKGAVLGPQNQEQRSEVFL